MNSPRPAIENRDVRTGIAQRNRKRRSQQRAPEEHTASHAVGVRSRRQKIGIAMSGAHSSALEATPGASATTRHRRPTQRPQNLLRGSCDGSAAGSCAHLAREAAFRSGPVFGDRRTHKLK